MDLVLDVAGFSLGCSTGDYTCSLDLADFIVIKENLDFL